MELQPRESIGDYEVMHLLGTGGMGEVYKVRNVISGRTEAMKIALSPGPDNELSERFLREIKVHSSLDHPNIAAVRTAQRAADRMFMILEYVDGETLEQLLRRGPLPIRTVVDWAIQVLDALDYAHRRGVVHRDIKPANIMVTGEGCVKLMDFGVAREPLAQDITRSGRAVGSLAYMSPEQIAGYPALDTRSDLYQVGLCLYECLTGTLPFKGDSDYALILARMQERAPAAMTSNPSVPAALSRAIAKALERNPGARYQSAAAFKAALRASISAPAMDGPQLSRLQWLNYAALGFTASMMCATLAAAAWTFLHTL